MAGGFVMTVTSASACSSKTVESTVDDLQVCDTVVMFWFCVFLCRHRHVPASCLQQGMHGQWSTTNPTKQTQGYEAKHTTT